MKKFVNFLKGLLLLLIILVLVIGTTLVAGRTMTNNNFVSKKKESQQLKELKEAGTSIVSPSEEMLKWEAGISRLEECCNKKGIKLSIVICPGATSDLSRPVGRFSIYMSQQDKPYFIYPSVMMKQMNVKVRNQDLWTPAGALAGVINVHELFEESVEDLRRSGLDENGNVSYRSDVELSVESSENDSDGLPALRYYAGGTTSSKALILGDSARINFSDIFAKDYAAALSASHEYWENPVVLEMIGSLSSGDVLVLISTEINIEECAALAELLTEVM